MTNKGYAPATAARFRGSRPAYVLALLTAVSFFNYLDRMVIAVMIEPIKRELALSDTQLGLITGFAFAMLYATMGLPLARVADRRSRITLMSICLVIWSGMTALTGLARNFIQLFAVRIGVGIGEAGCAPAAHSLLGDIYSSARRPFAISVFQAGGVLGQSLGLALTALAAQYLGWRTALVIVGLCGLPLALLIYLTVKEPARDPAHVSASAEPIMVTLKALLARAPLVHLLLAISVASFGSYGMTQWLPAFFIRSHGLSLAQSGAYIGIIGAAGGVLGTLSGGWFFTRLGLGVRDMRWELWYPMVLFGLFPLFMLPSLLTHDWRVACGFQLVGFFLGSAGVGVALSTVQTYAEPHRRATAIAIMLLMSSLIGLGLGPVAIGVISDWLAPGLGRESLRYALIVTQCMPVWSAVHFWLAARACRGWTLS